MSIFICADFHYGHKNILQYCERKFNSIEEMDQQLIKNFNSKVSPNDITYFLGDFSLSNNAEYLNYIFHSLNGKEKHLCIGNHDSPNALKLPWTSINHYVELKYNGNLICMMHYPIKIWNKKHHGSICLGGHSHLKQNEFKERYMDVGVDANSYFPVDLNYIVDKMQTIDVEYKHHKKEI